MKITAWLKKRRISYNEHNTVIMINGLRISSFDISTGKFNSKEDGILCEKYTKEGINIYWNTTWADIRASIN